MPGLAGCVVALGARTGGRAELALVEGGAGPFVGKELLSVVEIGVRMPVGKNRWAFSLSHSQEVKSVG